MEAWGHYTNQYRYYEKNPNIVIHIIKFENLEFEFNELMKKYKLNIVLDSSKNNKCIREKKFSVKSFTPEIIKLINKIYHKDFITFRYDKIAPNSLQRQLGNKKQMEPVNTRKLGPEDRHPAGQAFTGIGPGASLVRG